MGSADNNAKSKNANAKTDFNIYNIVSANVFACAGDISITSDKVDKNIRNTGVDLSSRVGGVNKSGLGMTNKSRLSKTNIETTVGLGGASKNKADEANKREAGKANIKTSKKTDPRAVASTKNSINSDVKIID